MNEIETKKLIALSEFNKPILFFGSIRYPRENENKNYITVRRIENALRAGKSKIICNAFSFNSLSIIRYISKDEIQDTTSVYFIGVPYIYFNVNNERCAGIEIVDAFPPIPPVFLIKNPYCSRYIKLLKNMELFKGSWKSKKR